jgi:catechol 2,3-dioxygenase-like lactoylglutathione lyase family enzyme
MTFRGVNHLALGSANMDRTVRFYTQALGLRLVRTQRNDDNPNSRHYFFDLGGGNLLAFFNFHWERRRPVVFSA